MNKNRQVKSVWEAKVEKNRKRENLQCLNSRNIKVKELQQRNCQKIRKNSGVPI